MTTDKEKFMEMLPRVGIAAESITAAINLYFPCVEEAAELFWEICKGAPTRGDVFTPEEELLIDKVGTKLDKLQKATDWLNS